MFSDYKVGDIVRYVPRYHPAHGEEFDGRVGIVTNIVIDENANVTFPPETETRACNYRNLEFICRGKDEDSAPTVGRV
jgi:hypothetical protein